MRKNLLRSILALTLSFFILSSSAQPGTLDSSFGVNGKITKTYGYSYSQARVSSMQQDGKIVVAGSTIPYSNGNKFLVSRFLTDGTVDSSFGVNGNVVTSFDTGFITGSMATSIIIQPDNKIIVGGFDYQASYFLIARYLPNGNLDSTFSSNGKANFIMPFGETELFSLALQKDGKILAGGNCDGYCLIRILSNGGLDSSFGINGRILNQNFHFIRDVIVQNDGKIITAGTTDFFDSKIELVRLLPNGSQDSTFGLNGSVQTSFFNNHEEALSIALLNNGSILMTGFASDPSVNSYRPILGKYKSNGSLDSSFGNNGKVVSSMTSTDLPFIGKILIQSDGKIIITGDISPNNFTVSRFTSNGIVDSTFGTNGNAVANFSAASNATSALLQSDGKIIAVGSPNFSLARFKGDTPTIVSLTKNITVTEGKTGTTTPATFTVTLNKAATKQVKVNYHTRNLSAKSGSDYVAKTGTITFGIGVTSKTVTVNVKGDNTVEPNERFAFVITDPTNAVLGTDSVICIIRNDDPSFTSTTNVDAIKTSSIKIYPNPVKDVITIDGLKANTIISIINEDGKTLSVNKTASSLFTQNIKQLSPGTYFVKIESDNKTETLKFIKQ